MSARLCGPAQAVGWRRRSFNDMGHLAALQTGINKQENKKMNQMQIFISPNVHGANDRASSQRSAAKRTNGRGRVTISLKQSVSLTCRYCDICMKIDHNQVTLAGETKSKTLILIYVLTGYQPGDPFLPRRTTCDTNICVSGHVLVLNRKRSVT